MNRIFGLKTIALATFAAGFLLSSSPAQAQYKTSMSFSCPDGIYEAVLTIQLASSTNPELISPSTAWRCGSDTSLGTVRSVKYVFNNGFAPDRAIYKITLPPTSSGGTPQGQQGECKATVAVPSSTTCSGGVPAGFKGVAKTKLVLR